MTETVDCAVIGAGAVGLAIARHLARSGREVVILDAADAIGTGISARNSEVIHAGIYYPPGSLKAKLCVAGKEKLYRFCAAHGVTHRRIGKLIVATDADQMAELDAIAARAEASGVCDLARLDAAETKARAPELRVVGALFSPSTGIVDAAGLMLSLLGAAEAAGAALALKSPVNGGSVSGGRIEIEVGAAAPMRLAPRLLINAAGLGSPALAAALGGFPPQHQAKLYLARGNYFALAGRSPFRHLIYPVPEPGGLGIHLTLDLAGQAKFGPDVEWIDRLDYQVDPARAERFYKAIRRYWPGLEDGCLQPAYAGIRPKLAPAGAPAEDFRIEGPATHGVEGLVNLFGIESPGLTSSLAIADHVGALLGIPPGE